MIAEKRAAMAGAGTFREQQGEVARFGSNLFGAPVVPEHVIGETLRRATPERSVEDPSFLVELDRRVADESRKPPVEYAGFPSHFILVLPDRNAYKTSGVAFVVTGGVALMLWREGRR